MKARSRIIVAVVPGPPAYTRELQGCLFLASGLMSNWRIVPGERQGGLASPSCHG